MSWYKENDEFVDDVSNPVRSRSSDDISNIEIEAFKDVVDLLNYAIDFSNNIPNGTSDTPNDIPNYTLTDIPNDISNVSNDVLADKPIDVPTDIPADIPADITNVSNVVLTDDESNSYSLISFPEHNRIRQAIMDAIKLNNIWKKLKLIFLKTISLIFYIHKKEDVKFIFSLLSLKWWVWMLKSVITKSFQTGTLVLWKHGFIIELNIWENGVLLKKGMLVDRSSMQVVCSPSLVEYVANIVGYENPGHHLQILYQLLAYYYFDVPYEKFNWEKSHNDIYKSKKNIFVKRIGKEKLKEVVDVGVDGKDTEGLIFILINFDLIKWVYERKVAKKPILWSGKWYRKLWCERMMNFCVCYVFLFQY